MQALYIKQLVGAAIRAQIQSYSSTKLYLSLFFNKVNTHAHTHVLICKASHNAHTRANTWKSFSSHEYFKNSLRTYSNYDNDGNGECLANCVCVCWRGLRLSLATLLLSPLSLHKALTSAGTLATQAQVPVRNSHLVPVMHFINLYTILFFFSLFFLRIIWEMCVLCVWVSACVWQFMSTFCEWIAIGIIRSHFTTKTLPSRRSWECRTWLWAS